MKISKKLLVLPLALSAPFIGMSDAMAKVCEAQAVGTPEMFQCEGYTSAPKVMMGTSAAYRSARQYFPQSWDQFGFNQRHNPVFEVPANAPGWLRDGKFWAAPLTGLAFQDVKRALPSVGDNGEAWGSTTSQYVGNVVGVSVVQGITFVQTGQRQIWAVDTATGKPIWSRELSSVAGMGQALVQEIDGRLMAFVPVGDAAFTLQNAIDFANNKPHFRGANFAGLHVFDALTGEPLWRFDTKGSERPTPIYKDGKLYVTTNGHTMSVLDAKTGTELGSFTNPGNGYSGLAAPNWMDTADGRRILVYGTIRPARILGVDVTNPTAPTLAWSYTPPGATANAPGDTSMAVDPDLGLAYTTVFTNNAGTFDLNLIAIDVASGTVAWSQFMGAGDSPPGFKGSIPMVHDGVVYSGNTLNGTFQAYNAKDGTQLWSTNLKLPSEPADVNHRPRAAGVYYDGKIIVVEGRLIHTLDAATGVEVNRFQNPGFFGVWGINQPVIIGKLAILSSISGWAFAAPVDYITTRSGLAESPGVAPLYKYPPVPAEYVNRGAAPKKKQVAQFGSTVLDYAGGQHNNSVLAKGPTGVSWMSPLKDAVALDAPPRDEELYGTEVATQMMHTAIGASNGLSPASGVLYVGSERFSVEAINATTGKSIWRAKTQNANFGQPLVTPNSVIVSSGDPWMNLGATGAFRQKSSSASLGDNWASVRAYDRQLGIEKWAVYTANGTSAMTPLYYNGNLYWVNGDGKVWAVNADTGAAVAPFMADGQPVLSLGGFNAISSANIHRRADGSAVMVVGMAMPNRMVAIDLTTASVAWTQDLASVAPIYLTGFAPVSPAVSQDRDLVVGTVLANADATTETASVLAYALDASSGSVVWSQYIGTGALPKGVAGVNPVIDAERAYFHNPIDSSIYALDLASGEPVWQSSVVEKAGKPSWGQGALVRGKLIQPVGEDLVTLDAATGEVQNTYHVGGAFTYNFPTVAGNTVYIGNSWGWALALPLQEVTGQ